MRVKCNRCGKPQMKNTIVTVNKNLSSTALNSNYKLLSSRENVNKIPNLPNNFNPYIVNNCKELINEHQNVNNNLNNFYDNNFKSNIEENENIQQENYLNFQKENYQNFQKENFQIFQNEQENYQDEQDENSEDQIKEEFNNMNLNKESNANSLTNKANSADSMKKKKPFVERVGDWVCIKCKNLNFSFRVVCNRCQLTKAESEKLFDQYMKNLMNYVKINELLQTQLQSQNSPNDSVEEQNGVLYSGNEFYSQEDRIGNNTGNKK